MVAEDLPEQAAGIAADAAQATRAFLAAIADDADEPGDFVLVVIAAKAMADAAMILGMELIEIILRQQSAGNISNDAAAELVTHIDSRITRFYDLKGKAWADYEASKANGGE